MDTSLGGLWAMIGGELAEKTVLLPRDGIVLDVALNILQFIVAFYDVVKIRALPKREAEFASDGSFVSLYDLGNHALA
ncbi:MAG: hypothetical protein FWB76_06080 [Oscillospiraceae bacterium]|nr:hypothetical protein [Oscillospiraceae bacterium]